MLPSNAARDDDDHVMSPGHLPAIISRSIRLRNELVSAALVAIEGSRTPVEVDLNAAHFDGRIRQAVADGALTSEDGERALATKTLSAASARLQLQARIAEAMGNKSAT